MVRKKSGFWRFIFSLLPGAGEMYMGFMKMGVSLMSIFFVLIAVASYVGVGPLLFVAAIVWFYSFFHVHNLASMPEEEFYAVEDDYLFRLSKEGKAEEEVQSTYRKIIAAALIYIGTVLLWKGIFNNLYDYVSSEMYWLLDTIEYRLPKIVVGILIIVLGAYMIRGKKQQIEAEERGEE